MDEAWIVVGFGDDEDIAFGEDGVGAEGVFAGCFSGVS